MALRFSEHANARMAEWRISRADVAHVLATGEVIEPYPDDRPFPSRLVLGWVGNRPIHVVAADDPGGETVVITVYEPDPIRWDPTFRGRQTR